MFKRYIKFIKVLVAVWAFCAVNFSVAGTQEKAKNEPVKEQQIQEDSKLQNQEQEIVKKIDEVKQEVLNKFNKYDKKDFQVEGFTNKIYYRKGLPILVYEHNKTKAKIVFQIFSDAIEDEMKTQSSNILFFRAFDTSDRELVHLCEHCILPMGELYKFEKGESIECITDQFGINIYIPKIYKSDGLKLILKNLRHPPDDEKFFEIEKNRVKNEGMNTSPEMKRALINCNRRFYYYAGFEDRVHNVKYEELKKLINDYIHPSNLLVYTSISDPDPINIKNYLKFLDEEYLKYFKYKDIKVKYDTRRDNNVFIRKTGYVQKGKSKHPETKFQIHAEYEFDMLNLNAKQKDALNLLFINDEARLEKWRTYAKSLGYAIEGCSIDDYMRKYVVGLFTDDPKLCEEGVVRENLKKIISFFKKEVESCTDEELEKCSNGINNFEKRTNDKCSPKICEYMVRNYYKNYKTTNFPTTKKSGTFYDFMRNSFAKHNNIFSDNVFDVNENNEILEDKNSIVKNIKENLNVFDILAEKGPTDVDIYDLVYLDEQEYKNLNKSYDKRSIFFVPIELKKYNNDEELFGISSYILLQYLYYVLGFENGLIYSELKPMGLENSKLIGYFFENNFSEDVAIKYLYKNFNKIMKNFKLTDEEFKNYIEKLREIVELEEKYRCSFWFQESVETLRAALDSFSKGEEGKCYKGLSKDTNLWDLKDTVSSITCLLGFKNYIFLKDLENLTKMRDGEKEFDKKYPDKNMKVTKEMVKDFKEMVFDNYYDLFIYSVKYYKNLLSSLNRVKISDVIKTIKSASLIKRDELEKMNNKLKIIWDTRLNSELK